MPSRCGGPVKLLALAILAGPLAVMGEPDRSGPWDGDAASIAELRTLTGHEGWVRSLAFARGGDLLISGSADHKVRLWSMPRGESIETLTGHHL